MLISVCIPTYNRPEHLKNCLNSLVLQTDKKFEVCISDNSSKTNTKKIIKTYKKKLNIKFNRNKKNLGFGLNLLKVSQMASSEFVWFLGDDDLLVPSAINQLKKILKKNCDVDFVWVNSSYLDISYIRKFKSPFNTNKLPRKMKSHSNNKNSKRLNFFELIDKEISFDYLLGVYVCVFRREKWNQNLHLINKKLISDPRLWSNFENTCFFIKIFCGAFKNSVAYFCAKPLSVNLSGVREWNNLYPFVEIVRIPEALDYYRDQGLGFFKYIYNKNYSLRNFFNYFTKILINGKKMGLEYIDFRRHVLKNLIYPNSWLSIFYFIIRRLKIMFTR